MRLREFFCSDNDILKTFSKREEKRLDDGKLNSNLLKKGQFFHAIPENVSKSQPPYNCPKNPVNFFTVLYYSSSASVDPRYIEKWQ